MSHESQLKTTSPRAKGSTVSPEEALNPPSSTLPPPLNLPTRDPLIPFYKHYFRLGRAYLAFYKSGFKAIYSNFRLAGSYDIKLGDSSRLAPYSSLHSIQKAVLDGILTRGQYHLFLRVKSDISRIPLFGLVFCVFGEFTPLVVAFLNPVVPKTLWLPGQWERARIKARMRKQEVLQDGTGGEQGYGPLSEQEVENVNVSDAESVRRLRRMARWMDAYPRMWDRLFGNMLPISVVRGRLRRKVWECRVDDFAINRDGGVAPLSSEELKIACDMRALEVLGKTDEDMRRELSRWLEEGRRAGRGEIRTSHEGKVIDR
ncbi:MAG: hypothetical protein Q9217_004533 [Psora testacea]